MRTALALLVIVSTFVLPGCIGFSGPSDVARRIENDRPIDLEKEMGINVGPVGVFLASAAAGIAGVPVKLDGLTSVDFGEYTVTPLTSDPRASCLRHFEVPGWEHVVRICEKDSDVLVLVNEGDRVRGFLVIVRDGSELHVVRAKGNFEKLIDNLLDSEMFDDAFDWEKHVGGAPDVMGDVDVEVDEDADDDDDDVMTDDYDEL